MCGVFAQPDPKKKLEQTLTDPNKYGDDTLKCAVSHWNGELSHRVNFNTNNCNAHIHQMYNSSLSHLILDLLPPLGFPELLQCGLPPHLLPLLPSGARLCQTTGITSIIWGEGRVEMMRQQQVWCRCLSQHDTYTTKVAFSSKRGHQALNTNCTNFCSLNTRLLLTTLWAFVVVSFPITLRYLSHCAKKAGKSQKITAANHSEVMLCYAMSVNLS